MASDFDEILAPFVADLQSSAKMELDKARAFATQYARLVVLWTQQANAAEVEGNPDLAASKRMSVEHVKNAAILDLATFGVERTNATETLVLAAFDKVIGALA